MSRLQSAARNCAIASLSVPSRVGRDEVSALYDAGEVPCGQTREAAQLAWRLRADIPTRLVRARLALYLRCLRRVELWEALTTHEDWSIYDEADPRAWAIPPCDRWEPPAEPWGEWSYRFKAWHPLWLDAPAHEPAVTPAMRRAKP